MSTLAGFKWMRMFFFLCLFRFVSFRFCFLLDGMHVFVGNCLFLRVIVSVTVALLSAHPLHNMKMNRNEVYDIRGRQIFRIKKYIHTFRAKCYPPEQQYASRSAQRYTRYYSCLSLLRFILFFRSFFQQKRIFFFS